MLYLMCLIPDGSSYRAEYTEITSDTERKITGLYRTNKLPESFLLNGVRIISDTILGFTDNPIPYGERRSESKLKSWDDLRLYVEQQDWYKRAKNQVIPNSPYVF